LYLSAISGIFFIIWAFFSGGPAVEGLCASRHADRFP
jgi:hypothetical protein